MPSMPIRSSSIVANNFDCTVPPKARDCGLFCTCVPHRSAPANPARSPPAHVLPPNANNPYLTMTQSLMMVSLRTDARSGPEKFASCSSERPLLAVDSTGRCNRLAKSFSGRFVVKFFSRAAVQLPCYFIERGLRKVASGANVPLRLWWRNTLCGNSIPLARQTCPPRSGICRRFSRSLRGPDAGHRCSSLTRKSARLCTNYPGGSFCAAVQRG